jgi:hypothetical protein
MASVVDICNLALVKLGAQPIPSLTSNDPKAAVLNRVYPLLRDKLLRVFRWNFTRVYTELPALDTAPPFEYSYAYQLPADYLRLELADVSSGSSQAVGMPSASINDWNFNRNQDYRIVGRQIWSNVTPPLRIQYAARIEDPAQYDAAFVESLASYIAWQLCEQLTGSNQKKEAARQEYLLSIREARMTNAIELPPETLPDDTFMQSRLAS